MESKLEFVLKPVSGAAEAGGGYRAYLTTAKGAALDSDDVIAEALDRGYIAGVKDTLAKSVVLGVLDSMIDGVLRDGVTRRIGEYLSVSLKIHGRFEDKDDDFDPTRHKLVLSVKQLGAFRPSFKGVSATNVDHKRQFRIFSVHSVGADEKNRRLVVGREFVIKGSDFRPDARGFGVSISALVRKSIASTSKPTILSATDNEIRCAWPDDFEYDPDRRIAEISVYRQENPDDPASYAERSVDVSLAVGEVSGS